jgi:uncharacterized tellurite resistance protein B-like protein
MIFHNDKLKNFIIFSKNSMNSDIKNIEMKLEKSIAGYHILMILSGVDGDFAASEQKVIEKYIKANFSPADNLDDETAYLKSLHQEKYMDCFLKAANDFYWNTEEQERNDFLNFAFKLIKADDKITKEENQYINELYNSWDFE